MPNKLPRHTPVIIGGKNPMESWCISCRVVNPSAFCMPRSCFFLITEELITKYKTSITTNIVTTNMLIPTLDIIPV